MNQEYRSSYSNIECTTIPYWDERCGEYFYHNYELEDAYLQLTSGLLNEKYKPREFILENLTDEKCGEKLKAIISEFYNINSKKNVLFRSNAKKEDDIWVTGELGIAALGLANIQNKVQLPQSLAKKSISALEKPMLYPPIIKKIAKLSHSAIDISDEQLQLFPAY